MIEWLTNAALVAQLETRFGGLWLSNDVQLRYPSSPATGLPAHHREPIDVEGLGTFDGWSGIAHGIPFVLTTARVSSNGPHYGAQINVPIAARSDLAILAMLAEIVPRGFIELYFQFLPVAEGYAVTLRTNSDPIYVGATIEEAEAVARLAREQFHAEIHEHVAAPTGFLVVGPARGDYITRCSVERSLEEATALAEQWSRETGDRFSVQRSLRP